MMTAIIAVFVSEIYSPLHQKIAFSIILKKAIALFNKSISDCTQNKEDQGSYFSSFF
jgi:hypothetical protein